MRSNMLQTVLNDLNGTSADIEAFRHHLIRRSDDGPPAQHRRRRPGRRHDAAMLSLGDCTARELVCGTSDQVLIMGERVTSSWSRPAPTRAHRDGPTHKLGLVFLDVRRAADAIGRILG